MVQKSIQPKASGEAFDFRNKRVLIMGLGLHGGGLEAVKYFLRAGAEVTVTDKRSARDLAPSIGELKKFISKKRRVSLQYVLGRHRASDFLRTDYILKNAGVRRDSPYLEGAQKKGIPILSDVGIFFEKCPAPIIGVTGTRGKSTTAYLISEFLRHKKNPRRTVYLGGNIRKSVLEFLPRIKPHDYVVLELSSFQLMDIAPFKKSPHTAVLTNVLNDHLNWHKNKLEYIRAKSVIFQFQKKTDHLFYNKNDKIVRHMVFSAPSIKHVGVLKGQLRRITEKNLGTHYTSSIALAVSVVRRFKVSEKDIGSVLARFRGLPGRQEEFFMHKGIRFVNDTTATIPDAAIAALKRFGSLSKTQGGGVVLIAGGSDKKLFFREFASEMQKSAREIILLPGGGTEKIKQELLRLKKLRSIHSVKSMKEAVRIAYTVSRSGDTVLLSPGATSFGLFLNEFDRGDQFVSEVKRQRPR